MPVTVADSLRRARGRRFVGRVAERELFEQALRGETALSVLFVHGPGGVGKTALLGALADAARDAGVPATRLDLRAIEPSPAAFREALAAAAAAGAGAEPPAARDADGRRAVLLLDTYEALGPLDAWLRERYLTELDAGTLVVIGGREPPAAAWHEDPGWRDLLRVVSLRNLRPEDARAYLRVADVPEALHDRVVDVTHGHPLALSLVVDVLDQRRASSGAPSSLALDEAPDLVRPLLARFMDAVPGTRQRAALEVCAHARFTTEDLLRGALGGGDAGELFAWLRTLSFVEEGPHGIFPHDIARDALDADLRWRDPDAYADLHRRVRTRVLERVCGSAGREQQRFATDVVFLHRRNPFTAAYWDWKTLGEAYADALRPSDRDVLVAMARRHEGAASAELVAHWLDRQPQAFHVFRRGDGEAIGFAAVIALHEAAERDVAADPGTRAIWEFSQRHGPARPGEEVLARRFFMDARAYQAPSPSFNMLTVLHVQEVVSRPRLAWDLIAAF
ncbi:MAG TPA: AAA family ATPase, partial [Solirubrobacteraceae bacterium]|nr:AAA family ATPase [Solirubrobacteraceae bacterium]